VHHRSRRRHVSAIGLIWLCSSCAHNAQAPPAGTRWVHTLQIIGNNAVSSGDIRDRLATQSTGWWPFASKKWFDRIALDLDLERIPAFYADRGYFDAHVVKHDVRPGPDDSVDITIVVSEGQPTRIQKVDVHGFPAPEEERARRTARRQDIQPGEIIRYDAYTDLRKILELRLKDRGYAYASVAGEITVDRDRHEATVDLTATPGPEVRMGKTELTGNGVFPTGPILNRVAWREGDIYSPRDFELSQSRIYQLGVFSLVRIELPPEPTATATASIKVAPGKLRELRLSAGLGAERARQEVRAGVTWTINNFYGGLRKLRIRLQPAYVVLPDVTDPLRSGFAADNDIQLAQPDLFGSKVSGLVLAGYDIGIDEGYQFRGPRGQLGVLRTFYRNRLDAGASYNLQYLTFYNVDLGAFFNPDNRFFGFTNPYRLAYLEETVQLDLRDRPLDPTLGAYFAVRAEQGVPVAGGQFHYLKVAPDVRVYFPLTRRVVVAGRALWGWLGTYHGDQSPITRRFELGGPSSHRGFGFGRLSPQVLDNQGHLIPIGGDGQVLFSIEARIAVLKISGFWARLVPFLDAGDVTPFFSDINYADLNLASGLSVEYLTPIGAIRAGIGIRINRTGLGNPDPGERVVFHLSIGEAF
jgi:outer membrane protein assembly factor BamA